MDDRFYITTPIYYVNAPPTVGTAYTTVVADALARFHRMRGRRVHFLTGTDEHGLKIEREAVAAGKTPIQFVDGMSALFREAWPKLLVQYDDFIRTTEERHKSRATELWKKCAANGDITLGEYAGQYCVRCEAFYTMTELVDETLCPIHKTPVESMKLPTYLFNWPRYQERLLALYESRTDMVLPTARRNEVLSFIRGGLQPISVSRNNFTWGIPVPGDASHVMYVWFDALTNYLTALGDGELRATFWPADVHLCGKDILRFHAVLWQAMLMSAGFSDEQMPRHVFSHGFLTLDGEKIGKSLFQPGSIIDPLRLAEYFGADELRYFLLREVALGQDGDFSHRALINRIRAELSATLGNLLHRTLAAFVVRHFDGKVPARDVPLELDAERALQVRARDAAAQAAAAWSEYAPHRALEAAMSLAIAGNKYFDDRAPWALAKRPEARAELGNVIYHVLEVVRIVSLMLWPAMPSKVDAIRAQLGLAPVAPTQGADAWPTTWGAMIEGAALAPGQPVFRNITPDDEVRMLKDFGLGPDGASLEPAAPKSAKSPKPAAAPRTEVPAQQTPSEPIGLIPFSDFEKVELRLGHVVSAERVPKKDKLLRLAVDLGEPGGPRTIIAGIALAYAPEQLVGKQLAVVANLAPRDFGKGLVSHGMLLACGPSESLSVLTVEKPTPAGTRIK